MKRVETMRLSKVLGSWISTVFFVFACGADARGQEVTLYLPQVADGGGSMTTFFAVNQAATAVNVTIELFSPSGAPLQVLNTGNFVTFTLAVGPGTYL